MIQRFVFVKLHDAEVPQRAAIAGELRQALASLGPLGRVVVGTPADDSASRWDLSVVLELPELATWLRIAQSHTWRATFAGLAVRAIVIKGWTFAAP